MDIQLQTSTELVIGCFYKVYNTLGYGFLEKVYERALLIELRKQGLTCEAQTPILVYYDGERVGEYFADILINDELILELKASETIVMDHELQLINYLKASNVEVGFLMNFGRKPEIRRKIFSNLRKNPR